MKYRSTSALGLIHIQNDGAFTFRFWPVSDHFSPAIPVLLEQNALPVYGWRRNSSENSATFIACQNR